MLSFQGHVDYNTSNNNVNTNAATSNIGELHYIF